jgi:long-chain fatty acid transport protein
MQSWVPDAISPYDGTRIPGYIMQRETLVNNGTNEFLAGLEWQLTDRLTIGTGVQYSKFGISDAWQNDITHHLDNFTWGIGAAFHINENLTLNVGGLNTWYNRPSVSFIDPVQHTRTYDRTNQAIAVGVDFRF